MRASLAIETSLLAALLSACASPSPPQVVTGCWEHRIEIPNSAGNLLTLCTLGETASGTIRFANLGGDATVCRQSGVAKALAGGGFSLAFERGSCDNGRSFDRASFQCTNQTGDSISCLHNTMTLPLVFTRQATPLPRP